jgi:predicted nucleotidyltransferase
MLSKEFKEFAKLLNDQKVEYLLVGGYAVVLYGYVRYTGDIDFWINPTEENANRIVEVLDRFGFGSLNLTIKDFTKDDQIIQLGYPPNRIDIITSVTGLTFTECYPKRNSFSIEGVEVQTISLEDLKKNKKASGRYKDLDDLENL